MRKAIIDAEKCKGCDLCISVCPVDSIKKSGKSNKKGYDFVEVNDKCTGCSACYTICPDCCVKIVEE